MHRILLTAIVAWAGLSQSASALQFTNVASPLSSGLMAATCDSDSTFVAVGTNSGVLRGNFASDRMQWQAVSAPGGISFLAAAYGNHLFLAGGTGGKVVASGDGLQWGSAANPFPNTAWIAGLGFNPLTATPRFVAVAEAVQIARTPASLPLSWSAGVLDQPSFVESFRAVTPFGLNGYAACGIGGDIRVSTDGGANWTISRLLQSGQNGLLGIASDGGNGIVAVGASGTILFSSNGGVSWSTRSSPVGAKSLNAVAYDGARGQFVIVGDAGTVLTSADGLQWSTASAGTSVNFHGITFGTGGNLLGIGLLVGDGGKAILAGTSPAAPTDPVGATNCSFALPNPALTVAVVPDIAHPAGTVGVDWYDGAGRLMLANSNSFSPPDIEAPANQPLVITYYARARDLRTGLSSFNSTPVGLTLYPRPTAAVTGTNTICNSQSSVVQAALTGVAPWTVTWASNGVAFLTNTAITLPLDTITVTPVNTNLDAPATVLYTVSAVSDFFACDAFSTNLTGGALITINPRPTATVSGTNTICNGQTTTVSAALTGLGPWNVFWSSNGLVVAVHSNVVTRIDTLNVAPVDDDPNGPTNAFYRVSALVDASTGCADNQGNDLTGGALITINPRPTSTLVSVDATNCNYGIPYLVETRLTGIGPWTVTWSDGATSTTNAPLGSSVVATHLVFPTNSFGANEPSNNVYYITGVSNADLCVANQAGDIVGTNVVTVNPRPTARLVSVNQTNCNDGTPYLLEATLSGMGPWTVKWSDGLETVTNAPLGSSVVATHLVFPTNFFGANLSSNNVYYVASVSNADSCLGNQAGDVVGTNVVTVNPRPTSTLVSLDVTNCDYGIPYQVEARLTGIGPWTIKWSDGATTSTNGPVGSSVVATHLVFPTNSFGANVPSNNVYYVISVTNADACLGNEVGDILGTNVVTVNPRPTARLVSVNQTNCNDGSPYVLEASLTGIGPWTVKWSDGLETLTNAPLGVSVVATHLVLPTNFPGASLPSNNVYYVESVANADTCLGNQMGDIVGTNVVTVNPRPTSTLISVNVTNCNDGTPYLLQSRLTGIGPWTVKWSDGATTSTNAPLGSSVVATHLVFPTNSFGANLPSNNVYYVESVTNADTCLGNQAGDILGTNVVTINPRPTSTLVSVDVTNCNYGTPYVLEARLTGLGPWTVKWSDNQETSTNAPAGSSVVATHLVFPTNFPGANLPSNNVYYVAWVTNADTCLGNQAGDVVGTNVVTVNPRPTARLLSVNQTNCNNGTPYVLEANLTGIGPWTVKWSDGLETVTNAPLGSPVIATHTVFPTNFFGANLPSNNVYYVESVTNADTCLGHQAGDILGTNVVTINPRPTSTLVSVDVTNCNYGTPYVLEARLTGLGPWTVRWSDNEETSTNAPAGSSVVATHVVFPTNTFEANLPSNNVYYVAWVTNADTCLGNQAGDIVGTNVVTVNPRPTARLLSLNQTNCNNGTPYVLEARLTGIGPWTVKWSDGLETVTNAPLGSPVVATHPVFPTNFLGANLPSNNVYYVESVTNADTCLGNQAGDIVGTNVVTVNPRPTSTLVSVDVTDCNYGTPYVLAARLTGIGPWTVRWSDNEETTTNAPLGDSIVATHVVFPTNSFGSEPSNNVYYVKSVTNADTCLGDQPGDIAGTNVVTVNPNLEITALPASQTNCPGTTAHFIVGATGVGLTYQWYKGASTLSGQTNSSLILTNVSAADAGDYSVVVNSSCRGPLTNTAALVVNDDLHVVTPLSDEVACVGGNALLSVTATGSGLSYQWYKGSSLLGQETSSSLLLTNVSLASTGLYRVVITGQCGTPATNEATLSVSPVPEAPLFLADQTNCAGFPNPPLTVSVTNVGVTVDWYNGPTNGALLVASNTPSITPLGTVTTTYYAEARDLVTGCTSTGRTAVAIYLLNCPVISLSSNQVIIQWFGELQLETTFALSNPPAATVWQPVTNGVAGAMNSWTNAIDAPQQYFRVNTGSPAGPVLLLSRIGDQVVVAWLGNHALQATPLLAPASALVWTNVGFGSLGVTNFWTNTLAAPQGFFRLNPNALP